MCGSESLTHKNTWFHKLSHIWSLATVLDFLAQCGAHHGGEFRPFAERWVRPFIESELQLVHRWQLQDWLGEFFPEKML